MHRLEIITPDELLLDGWNFSDFQDLIIKYNTIKNNLNTCNQYHGGTMQVFTGVNYENMHELEKYRITL